MDLHSVESARIGPGERIDVGTGLAVEIPSAMAGLILPRSGLALRHGISLVNSPGLIDSGYRGEIRVILLNTDPTQPFSIDVGDRIAQLVITSLPQIEPVWAERLESSERDSKGFGSSGIKPG